MATLAALIPGTEVGGGDVGGGGTNTVVMLSTTIVIFCARTIPLALCAIAPRIREPFCRNDVLIAIVYGEMESTPTGTPSISNVINRIAMVSLTSARAVITPETRELCPGATIAIPDSAPAGPGGGTASGVLPTNTGGVEPGGDDANDSVVDGREISLKKS